MTEGKSGARLKVLALLCAFMFAALGTRLWFVQVLAHAQLKQEGSANATRTLDVPAPRGRILDRNGVVLARNRTSLVVTVNRQDLPTGPSRKANELRRLAIVLGISTKEMQSRIDTKRYYEFTPVPVAFDVPKKTFFYLGEHRPQFPGVAIVQDSIRDYLEGPLAAHVLGYVGPFSPTEAANPSFPPSRYSQDDIVGKSGVELSYEHYLQGTKGHVVDQVNSAGRNVGPVPGASTPPVAGGDVYLTLDSKIQQLAAESLAKGMKAARTFGLPANAGAVVVMDPNTGGLLAMASNPTFDPNWFATGNNEEINRLFAQPKGHNLCNSTGCAIVNRAMQSYYPPGSTFKPFIALSALHREFAHTSGPKSYIPCPATYQVPGTDAVHSNWEPVNLGSISLAHALVVSCDTVFYQLGWDNWLNWYHQGQHDYLQHDLMSLGFGHLTGIDIPSENSGIIPDPAYKQKAYADDPVATDRNWQPGDYINMSIGQGDVSVTPLQLATAYSALANGGTVYRPHVLDKIVNAKGQTVLTGKPHVNGHLPFSKRQMDYVRNALTGVVRGDGTAVQAFQRFPLSRIPVAGKTGTAEKGSLQPFSWFAAMAPANDPQYVVVSLVEQGGHGSQSAAPIVRRILDGLFGLPLTDPATGTAKD